LSELFPKEVPSPKEARKLAFQYVLDTFENLTAEAISGDFDFVYEGHFGSHATWETPKRFKQAGYVIHLIFLGLSNPDLSQLRVIDRVDLGGHFVDRLTIENNFYGNLEMLNLNFRFIDYLTIVDTSKIRHTKLANLESGITISSVIPQLLPHWFKSYLADITALIT
jgi:predicted ABC-type ATPase